MTHALTFTVPRGCAACQALTKLALQLVLHFLAEYPCALGPATPGAALVPVLGQFLSCSSADIQELCLAVMHVLVLQQQADVGAAAGALQHTTWLLQCAADGALAPAGLSGSLLQGACACMAACVTALQQQGLLELHAEGCVAAVDAGGGSACMHWTRGLAPHQPTHGAPLAATGTHCQLPQGGLCARCCAPGARPAAALAAVAGAAAGHPAVQPKPCGPGGPAAAARHTSACQCSCA